MEDRSQININTKAAEGASVINLASLAGRCGGHAGSLVYSTTKGAIITWTRSLAAELGPYGIRVNAVAPGLILGTRFHNVHTTKESADATIKTIPLGRAGNSEDVAREAMRLAGHKLPIKCKFVRKSDFETLSDGGDA